MTPDQIRDTILTLARQQLQGVELGDDREAFDALDSVQRLTLVVAIEDHFSLAFAPEDDEAVRSLDDVVALVARGLAQAEATPGG